MRGVSAWQGRVTGRRLLPGCDQGRRRGLGPRSALCDAAAEIR